MARLKETRALSLRIKLNADGFGSGGSRRENS
jgi:hypothetical protein